MRQKFENSHEKTKYAQLSLITKSNALARARWPAKSVLEPRLVALVASKISRNDRDDEEFKTYSLHISELFGKHYGSSDISELKRAIQNIMSYNIEICEDGGDKWTICHIFALCSYTKSTGIIEVCFHRNLLPHYIQFKQYVQYKLADFLSIPSLYSQRMYEYLKSWSSCPTVTVSLDDLYKMMDLDEYIRTDFAQFRIRVLEQAKKDLEPLGFMFEWTPIKKGRKVEKIRFTFPNPRTERWKRIREEAIRENMAQTRAKALTCYTIRGQACVGGHQHEAVCRTCLEDREKDAKNAVKRKRNGSSQGKLLTRQE